MSEKCDRNLIEKRAGFFVDWMINNPELAKKEYPELVEKIENGILKEPSFVSAVLIQNFPNHFKKNKEAIDGCLPESKIRMVKQYIDDLNCIINYNCSDHIEQQAHKSVKDELLLQLKYWEELLAQLLKQTPRKEIQRDLCAQVFSNEGYELFCYLDANFTVMDKTLPAKYSAIFHYLKYEGLLKCTQQSYLSFIGENHGVKISKIQRKTYKYEDEIQPILNRLYAKLKLQREKNQNGTE